MQKILLYIVLFTLIPLFSIAQGRYTSNNKKAIKSYEEALVSFNRMDYANAILLMQKAIKADDQFIEAYLVLAEIYIDSGNNKMAIDSYLKAIKIDPDFAASYAALGGIWSFLKQMNFVTTDQAAPHITPNIQKAKALDPDLAEVYYWDAINLVWTDYNWDAGETAFIKAIDLNPNSSETRGLYSNFLLGQNRIEKARKEMDIALLGIPSLQAAYLHP